MPAQCETCRRDEYMPFVCKFCKGRFCAEHRLPENHACRGLDDYREKVRAEGRFLSADPGSEVLKPQVRPSAEISARLAELRQKLDGHAAHAMLAIMGGVFVLQILAGIAGLDGLMGFAFLLGQDFLFRPWTLVTSIYAHSGFYHLFGNAIVLFFFGPALEGLIGSKRFTWLFLGTGVLGGLAEILFIMGLQTQGLIAPGGVAVLGASGAIMGVLGTLTILAPRLSVLVFFVIPAPLWAITTVYAFLDVIGIFSPGRGVANLAHLAGLAAGMLYAKYLHSQGLRAYVQRPQGASSWRRYF
ncbi:MAG TPA: rhomboid family intramembrane serine protease [Candidatus Thermoplasmatota archaeon]|nr:rhomboid family intramembrane serine protease [Candidatus Thermoplasmatota archaeon]